MKIRRRELQSCDRSPLRPALISAVVLIAALAAAVGAVMSAPIDGRQVRQAAEMLRTDSSLSGERPSGELALDALEERAKSALAAIEHPADKAAWQAAVPLLRRRLAEAIGYEQLGPPQPRHVRRVGTLDRGKYVVEKLTWETFPDTLVPALLYRPAKVNGPLPAILFVPGHWWHDSKTMPDFQAFCIHMALSGYVVLTYDPHGQGERGVSFREHRRTELLLAGMAQQALMVFESKCALEYLLSRPEVDRQRVGITGASGGGYNTWTMTALDDRIRAAVPVVGTSEFYEQLHVCRPLDWYQAKEHCHFVPGLIRFANNQEYLALAAPRPVLIIAAHNDQSFPIPGIREVAAYGEKLYSALGQREKFSYFEDETTGHGYQQAKREAAYGFFARWLKGEGDGRPIPEPAIDIPRWDDPDLKCFPDGQKKPAGPGVVAAVRQLLEQLPRDEAAPDAETLRGKLREALGLPAEAKTSAGASPALPALERSPLVSAGGLSLRRVTWKMPDGVIVPALWMQPAGEIRGAVLAVADAGKESLIDHQAVGAALGAGLIVVAADVRGTGELAIDKPGWTFAVSLLLRENYVGTQARDLIAARQILAAQPELEERPIGYLGAGVTMSLAALYAAALDPAAAHLATDGGFVTYRSLLDRPQSLAASFTLVPMREQAWEGIDREIPAALVVYDVLRRLDVPDLYSALAPRPVLLLDPIDGDWQPLSPDVAGATLKQGRYACPHSPKVYAGGAGEAALKNFYGRINGQ